MSVKFDSKNSALTYLVLSETCHSWRQGWMWCHGQLPPHLPDGCHRSPHPHLRQCSSLGPECPLHPQTTKMTQIVYCILNSFLNYALPMGTIFDSGHNSRLKPVGRTHIRWHRLLQMGVKSKRMLLQPILYVLYVFSPVLLLGCCPCIADLLLCEAVRCSSLFH